MKRIIAAVCLLVLLAGCSGKHEEMDRAMALRSKLLAQGAAFDAEITADYGKELYTFSVACQLDVQGKLSFSVTAPESIQGIGGEISTAGGALTFDEEALSFPLLADGQVTPVSAPWVLMRTLRSGYLTSCGLEGDTLRIAIDDSYEEHKKNKDKGVEL